MIIYDENVKLLEKGIVDILLGPLLPPMLVPRNFFYSTHMPLNYVGIVCSIRKNYHFMKQLKSILKDFFGFFFICVIGALILYVHIVWFVERGGKLPEIPKTYFKGIIIFC